MVCRYSAHQVSPPPTSTITHAQHHLQLAQTYDGLLCRTSEHQPSSCTSQCPYLQQTFVSHVPFSRILTSCLATCDSAVSLQVSVTLAGHMPCRERDHQLIRPNSTGTDNGWGTTSISTRSPTLRRPRNLTRNPSVSTLRWKDPVTTAPRTRKHTTQRERALYGNHPHAHVRSQALACTEMTRAVRTSATC